MGHIIKIPYSSNVPLRCGYDFFTEEELEARGKQGMQTDVIILCRP